MKYPIFFTCVLATILSFMRPASLMAQEKPREPRHSFEMGYGFHPVLEISRKVAGLGGWGSSWSRETFRPIGAFTMGYSLDVSKRLQLGVTCSYLSIKEEYESRNPGSSADYRVERTKSWALMPKVSYKWYDKEDGSIYSSLLMGVDVREGTVKENSRTDLDETKTLYELAYQVTVLGARLGNKKGIFAELGFGYSGLNTVGFFLKL
ncbi:hypothetical protein GU926_05685 [Nibribacter ruber]|uniref:Outer membrane beta-barrel protein n=1 Tax=Nibribacter ruber TaxID=2698458 RepID=A0A6P1NX97_9BACT|nr:hypothetical protein [Nibribacter ruber]QHL86954.1 hypothetical protein GU926_05685 [Nibribacter ruber]